MKYFRRNHILTRPEFDVAMKTTHNLFSDEALQLMYSFYMCVPSHDFHEHVLPKIPEVWLEEEWETLATLSWGRDWQETLFQEEISRFSPDTYQEELQALIMDRLPAENLSFDYYPLSGTRCLLCVDGKAKNHDSV